MTLRANQNVTGLALTTFGVGFGNFFGGSLIKLSGSELPSVILTATSNVFRRSLPFAGKLGWFGKIFLSYGFLAYLAVVIALVASYILKRTRAGLQLRAVGESPNTADAAGINVNRYKYVATCTGSMIAGLGGLYYVMDYASGMWSNNAFGDRGWLAHVHPLRHEPGRQGAVQDGALCDHHHRAGPLQHAQQAGESAARLPGPGLLPRRTVDKKKTDSRPALRRAAVFLQQRASCLKYAV